MIRESEIVKQAFDKLVEHCKTMERGQTITYDEIASICGLTRRHRQFKQTIKRLRSHLLNDDERHVWLEAVNNVGFKFCTPDQQIDQTRKHTRKAARSLYRGMTKAQSVPDSLLSERQKIAKYECEQRARSLRNACNRNARLFEVTVVGR